MATKGQDSEPSRSFKEVNAILTGSWEEGKKIEDTIN